MKRTVSIFTGLFLLISVCGSAFAGDEIADSHFHSANYAMQGVPLREIVDKYMGDKITRSVVFPLPLEQKWDDFEHYADDKMPPNYYMGPKAGLYYYSAIDVLTAMDYLKLSAAEKARLDPMIVGFNPMDRYGVTHIKRMLILFPGVFDGIGEFSVHKEIVEAKIDDDPVGTNMPPGTKLPPDATDTSKNTLYNPSLKTIFDFAGEAGLVVCLHSDIYPAIVSHDGKEVKLLPEKPYAEGMKHLCQGSPAATVDWAHTGLGRFVKPTADHLKIVSEILDACPNWYTDLSWDLVQAYIVSPRPGMPTLDDWADFVKKYQDRILWGSDIVIYTKNKMDGHGDATLGKPMSVADYLEVKEILNPLWEKVGPEVAHRVRYANHVRIFDAARVKVRAWEKAHAADNVWDLSVQSSHSSGLKVIGNR
jgi:hypothetical protein